MKYSEENSSYLENVFPVLSSCPEQQNQVNTKNSQDSGEGHGIFSQISETSKRFVKVNWIWCCEEAPCEGNTFDHFAHLTGRLNSCLCQGGACQGGACQEGAASTSRCGHGGRRCSGRQSISLWIYLAYALGTVEGRLWPNLQIKRQ